MLSSPIRGNGVLPLTSSCSPFASHPSAKFVNYRWSLRSNQDGTIVTQRTKGQAVRLLANPNVSPRKRTSKNEVIMVDPLEAKRLAAQQMLLIQAKEKFKRKRQIEAINGAWAMIGLTAGLVIEGHTGKSIPMQLEGYWSTVVGFFIR